MTQLMFKGYEESRVALTALLFTMPCCILMGVEYAVFMGGDIKQVSDSSQMVPCECRVAALFN